MGSWGSLLATTALGLTIGVPPHQLTAPTPLPMVVSAVEPTYPDIAKTARIEGTVELNVTTDGEHVTQVDIVKSAPLLDAAAQRDVRSWAFAPHRPTSFRMTVVYELRSREFVDPDSCVTREDKRIATHDLPTRVDVIGVSDVICHREWRVIGRKMTASALAGTVVCDCPGSRPLSGIDVEISRQPTESEYKSNVGRFEKSMTTGRDGRFKFADAPAGDYSVWIGGLEYNGGAYQVQLKSDHRTRPELRLRLAPNPAVERYLKEHPREPNWIGADKRIPIYPLEAWKANIEGVVVLRMTPGSAPSVVEGNPVLAASAMDYAKGWTVESENNQPFDVRIVYKLVDADDIGGGPKTVMNLPREIEITAKRAPAGPNK